MRNVSILLLAAVLTACGQTGPLQMPPPAKAPPPPPAAEQPVVPEASASDTEQ